MTLAGWRARVREAWRALRRPAPLEPGRIVNANAPGIDEGWYYDRPVIVPGWVREKGPKAVAKLLTEASQRQTMAGQFDAPYRSAAYDGPITMPTEDPLEEWAFDTRKVVLTNSHAAFQRNPLAKQAVTLTRQFTVGRGHAVTCRNMRVQEVIDEFRANPEAAVEELDKTLIQDLQVDGELFLRKVRGGPGGGVVVPIPPWHITEIETDPGFYRRVYRYHLVANYEGGTNVDEWIPAEDMLHVAINRHSYELRGRPDLFAILPWLRAYKEWLENRARQNQWRGAVVYDVRIAGGTPGAVANAVSRYSRGVTTGSVNVHSDKEEFNAITNPVGGADASEDGRQIKLNVAVGMGLPEYMLSDGQNANLASATAQQLPALWRFTDAQQTMAEQVWKPVYKWVIEMAVAAGKLPEMVTVEDTDGDAIEGEEQIKAVDAFSVSFPELQADDPKTLTEALAIATMNQWVSDEGAAEIVCSTLGLDAAKEKKRVAAEKEEARDEAAQGLAMMPPPSAGEGEQGVAGEDEEEDQDQRERGNRGTNAPAPAAR